MSKYPNCRRHWSQQHLALLAKHYPLTGSKELVALLGRPAGAIVDKASLLGIPYTGKIGRPATVKPAPVSESTSVVHDPHPKAANTLKPMQVAVPVNAPMPTKRSPNTPNLNARIEARLRESRSKKADSVLDEVKALPANSEGRQVYALAARHGGQAATEAFRQWQQKHAA